MVNGLPPVNANIARSNPMRIGLDLNEKPAFTVADSAFDSAVQGRGETLRMKAGECQDGYFLLYVGRYLNIEFCNILDSSSFLMVSSTLVWWSRFSSNDLP